MTMLESTTRQARELENKIVVIEKELIKAKDNKSASKIFMNIIKRLLHKLANAEESIRQQTIGKRFTEQGWVAK